MATIKSMSEVVPIPKKGSVRKDLRRHNPHDTKQANSSQNTQEPELVWEEGFTDLMFIDPNSISVIEFPIQLPNLKNFTPKELETHTLMVKINLMEILKDKGYDKALVMALKEEKPFVMRYKKAPQKRIVEDLQLLWEKFLPL